MSKFLKNRKGGALVVVLIVMVVLTILGGSILSIALSENRFSIRQEKTHKAYYIARSGAQSVAEYMIKDPKNKARELVGKTSLSNNQIGGGSFSVRVEKLDPGNDILLTSTGTYKDVEQTAKIRLKGTAIEGLGGIFKHAIAAVNMIFAGNENANNSVITGSVTSRDVDVPDYIIDKVTNKADSGKDPTLVFPSIVLPPNQNPVRTYDADWGNLDLKNTNKSFATISGAPKYVRADSITIKNGTLSITGGGILHLYIVGGSNSGGFLHVDTNGKINIEDNSKLIIYVIPSENNPKDIIFEGNGQTNGMFLYAPYSKIEANNAQSTLIKGAIIGHTVEIHNGTTIEYDGSLAPDADLKTDIGVNYEGYIWVD